MVILAATLTLFSLLLYNNFKRSLNDHLDDLLHSKAYGVADSIDTYWETEKLEVIKYDINLESFSKINNINFKKIAERWVEEKSQDPRLIGIIVQIFDINGQTIAASKRIPYENTLSKEALRDALANKNRLGDLKADITQGKSIQLRIFTLPVIESSRVAYIVQVASPMTPLTAALGSLRVLLFFLLPFVVILTGIIGSFLATLTLKPVNQMTQSAQQITVENLKLRIPIPETQDEMTTLAKTFNAMLDKIDKAFTAQKQFAQDMSHELRTPLTILKGELETTLKKVRNKEDYEYVLRSNLEEVNRIYRIVEDLLTLAKLDSRELSLSLEQFELKLFLEEIVNDFKILAEPKGIAITLSTPSNIFLKADRNHLRRALMNLLDNALKYNRDQGRVDLNVQKELKWIKIEIRDTGAGIPAEHIPFIFDRFYRIESSRHSEGVGLGLSIVRSIIEAHGGRIEVSSQVHKGTAFTVALPA